MKGKLVFKIVAIILGVFAIISIGKGVMWYRWSHLSVTERAVKITDRMTSRLDLTSEQKEKVLALNLEKIKSIDGKDFWKNHHRKASPIYEDWKKEMKEILNEEQEKKMKL